MFLPVLEMPQETKAKKLHREKLSIEFENRGVEFAAAFLAGSQAGKPLWLISLINACCAQHPAVDAALLVLKRHGIDPLSLARELRAASRSLSQEAAKEAWKRN